MTQPKKHIFEGVRVLDLVSREAGATLTGAVMADFGADVIKIDRPGEPDPVVGRHYVKDGINLPYKVKGRNKRHITLDISVPQGRDLFHKLVAESDVVIESFPVGTMEEWGHGWETLSSINPGLIFCRVSDYGQTGPYKNRRLDGRSAEAFCGFAFIDGEPDGSPIHSQFDMGGGVAGIWSALGVSLALLWRDARGGTGQVVDVGLYEPLYRQIQSNITPFTSTGVPNKRAGSRKSGGIPWVDTHETKDDKYFTYSAVTRATMRDQMLAMGMTIDPRFKDFSTTFQNRDAYHEEAAKWMKQRTVAEVDDAFKRYECSSTPVMTAEDLCNDPHLQAREDIITVDDPDLGPVRMQGIVPKFEKTPGAVRHTGERQGARNQEVYGELLGLGAQELDKLKAAGVI
jgi:crotonobetainyl-CoA:carnitine CoA-transferase CaiB-like acyl-CoA transferase